MSKKATTVPSGVFDADGHIVEPDATFVDHLDSRFRSYVPRPVVDGDTFRYVCGDRTGFVIHARPETVGAPGQTTLHTDEPVTASGGADPAARLVDMDVDGIERAALYPTYGLMIQGVTDRAAALALSRAVNDWLAEFCRHAPDRLIGVGTLPMVDADDALGEARRCIEELGFRGVWRRPERVDDNPSLHDAVHDPLFAYLADAGMPLAIHPGLNGVVPYEYFGDRFDDEYTSMHAAHFPVEQIMNLTDLVVFGVLDRHPNLRVALLETGAVWALAQVHRLEEHLETFGFPAEPRTRPTEQFARQCFVSVEEPEPGLSAMLDRFPDSVVFASDYPHGDGIFPGSTAELAETDQIDDEQRQSVFVRNAERLYGLDS